MTNHRLVLACAALVLGLAGGAQGARKTDEPAPALPGLELWADPRFQQEMLHALKPNSDVEPTYTVVEKEAMEKRVMPHLASDPDRALAELEQLATPESTPIFDFTLGSLLFQQERLDEAVLRYRAAVEKFPAYLRAHKNLGLIAVRQGRFEDAVGSLSRVIQLGGNEGLVYGLLGYSYSSTEQYVPAESAYRQALLLQPDVLDWKLGLTQSVLKQQKYGEVAALCDELIARYPERSDYWVLQANAYIGLKEPLRAAENFEIVRRMGKETVPMMNTLGDIYVNEGLLDLGARSYGRAFELDPGQDLSQPLRRVEILAQRGALERAEELLDRIDEASGGRLDDEERLRLLKLRSRMAVAAGRGEGSIEVLEEIAALNPLDGEALILLGQHYATVEPEKAVFYYERAESLEDFEADARTRHAQLLVGQERYREAVPLLKRAQELRPREDIARYLEQVERLARAQR
jgi:tetratricopeptide (TPR) repeat protein